MKDNSSNIPDFLAESCLTLGLTERENIHLVLQRLFAANPETSLPAESLPVPLEGIREWAWQVVARQQYDVARLSIAMWFSAKLSLWRPKYKSLAHYYVDGCGFSKAQGERHCYHGDVLVALVLAGIPARPTEKQARGLRKIVPRHLIAEFFLDFHANYDPSYHQHAGVTKRAAVRFSENRLLAARKAQMREETVLLGDVVIPNGAGTDSGDPSASPKEAPLANEEFEHSQVAEIRNLLKTIAPERRFDEFIVSCVDAEFRRLRRNIDEPPITLTPLLDTLTGMSLRHRQALEILFVPRIEALLKHLIDRESRAILKSQVGEELAPPHAQMSAEMPVEVNAGKKPRKKRADKTRVIDAEHEPELPFGPPATPPVDGGRDVQASSPVSAITENDNSTAALPVDHTEAAQAQPPANTEDDTTTTK